MATKLDSTGIPAILKLQELTKEEKAAALTVLLLVFPGVIIINIFGFVPKFGLLFVLAPAAILALLNFRMALLMFFLSFFVNYIYFYTLSVSTIAGIVLTGSYFITHTFREGELKNPLLFPLLILLTGFLPSIFKSIDPATTIILYTQLFVFAGIITALNSGFRRDDVVKFFMAGFLTLAVFNVISIFIGSFMGRNRVFGFAGIMFVDYAGLLLSFLLPVILYTKKRRFLYVSVFVFILLGLILTQTRNAWISTLITISLILFSYIRSETSIAQKTKKVLQVFVVLFILAAVALIAYQINPTAFSRVTNPGYRGPIQSEEDLAAIGTFATRMFIWITAFQAFIQNPLLGVGIYSFPFSSGAYSTLDPIIYEMFVRNLSPHLTLLEVLSETGIIGFAAFGIFIWHYIKLISGNLRFGKSRHDKIVLAKSWAGVYILFSMLLTDAWLWGHGLILWGVIIAMNLAVQKEAV